MNYIFRQNTVEYGRKEMSIICLYTTKWSPVIFLERYALIREDVKGLLKEILLEIVLIGKQNPITDEDN